MGKVKADTWIKKKKALAKAGKSCFGGIFFFSSDHRRITNELTGILGRRLISKRSSRCKSLQTLPGPSNPQQQSLTRAKLHSSMLGPRRAEQCHYHTALPQQGLEIHLDVGFVRRTRASRQ